MKKLYKDSPSLPAALQWVVAVLCGAAYVVCCLPSFYWIGKFALQCLSSVFLSFLVTAVIFLFVPRSLRILDKGLSLFLIAMLLFASYRQVLAQMASESVKIWWIHTFFYDRPFTVAMVWCTAFSSVLFLRLFTPFCDALSVFRVDFSGFFYVSFRVFLVFYALVLVYCFFLQRQPSGQSGFNLIPFAMMISYIGSFRYAYETIFYVLGNLLCFLPLGFYLRIRQKNVSGWRILSTPVVFSLLIEASQLLFNTGQFDVDDIIMNAVGYYIGFGIAYLFDFTRKRITAGEETSIFDRTEQNA